jgi:hypothetical protein
MLENRFITTECEHCQKDNNVPFNYFVNFDYKFEKSAVATCQACKMDFIATFNESMVL